MHLLPYKVNSRYSNTYTKTSKRLRDWETAYFAAQNGHLHILEYLVERKYDEYHAHSCVYAARNGHLDCLKYLRETAKAPWNYWAVLRAHKKNQTECLQYLPRQQLSSPTWLVLRRRNFTHLIINTHTHTHERETHREKEVHHLRL